MTLITFTPRSEPQNALSDDIPELLRIGMSERQERRMSQALQELMRAIDRELVAEHDERTCGHLRPVHTVRELRYAQADTRIAAEDLVTALKDARRDLLTVRWNTEDGA